MKYTLGIITSLLLITGCSQNVNYSKNVQDGTPIDGKYLFKKDDKVYLSDSPKPYSGEAVWSYHHGQIKMKGAFNIGEKDGTWTEWYSDGKIKGRGNFKDGKKDGLWNYWYENGQKCTEGTFKKGQLDGLWIEWWKNGNKKEVTSYLYGEQIGKAIYYTDGEVELDYVKDDVKVFMVKEEKIPLRYGSGSENEIIRYLYKGDHLITLNMNEDWWLVKFYDYYGYVYSNFLTEDNSIDIEYFNGWMPVVYWTGDKPDCIGGDSYTLSRLGWGHRRDYGIEHINEITGITLTIKLKSNMDAIVQLIEKTWDRIVEVVYVKNGDDYVFMNIPEGIYYLKIAYGNELIINKLGERCEIKFKTQPLYEITEKIDLHISKFRDFGVIQEKIPHIEIVIYDKTREGISPRSFISEKEYFIKTDGMGNVPLKLTGQKSTEAEITRQSELVTSEVDENVDITEVEAVVEEATAPAGGIKIGVGTGFTVYTGEYFAEYTSAPSIDIFVRSPYLLYLGPLKVSFGAELQTFSFTEGAYTTDISGIGLMGVTNFNIFETPVGAVYAHIGAGYLGSSLGYTSGLSIDYAVSNVMGGKLSANVFLKANGTLDGGHEASYDNTASTGWANFGIALSYGRPSSRSTKSRGGPSPSVDGTEGRPQDCGSAEIDNFKNAAFDLNDKIVGLKDKLDSVSDGLAASNTVLKEIADHPDGPIGWSSDQLMKGFSKSKNSITAAVKLLKSDIPDLPEIYFELLKESTIGSIPKILTGADPEEAIVTTFNSKAKEKGIPTTSKEWIQSLSLELDPTKMIRDKLGTLKTGVVDGAEELKSVPDDLKAIGEQAQSLLASAGELPKVAKSLGFSKAPSALKSIKTTTGVLKNIPNEVAAIGDETKKVMEEIDSLLKNIENILSSV